jgi:tripartite-type tricarboxylate transporter receptor subunit TctC
MARPAWARCRTSWACCWSKARACRCTHVPFQGGGPANTALLGGHIGYKFDVVSETAELHRGGKVRIIAVTGDKRDPQVPEVPTLKESGVNMVATAWFAMYGPAGSCRQTAAVSAAKKLERPAMLAPTLQLVARKSPKARAWTETQGNTNACLQRQAQVWATTSPRACMPAPPPVSLRW